MGWIILFIASLLIFFIFIPYKNFRHLWHYGVIGMIILYAIDPTLIKLSAFSYPFPNNTLRNIPTFYWLSSFFGGIIFVYHFPEKRLFQFPYIILSSFLFTLLELIMYFFGYITYYNWTIIQSFFLDIFGLIIVIWLSKWFDDIKKDTLFYKK